MPSRIQNLFADSAGRHMMRQSRHLFALVVLSALLSPGALADDLSALAADFWAWRATEQPYSTDDIARLDRPAGWTPDWSAEAVRGYQKRLAEFQARWQKLDLTSASVDQQVDYRLTGSAIARVRWELDILRSWQRNPLFYVDQTVGAYFHLLLPPPPFNAGRTAQVVATLGSVGPTLGAARANLVHPVGPFAQLAIERLQDIRAQMQSSVNALKPHLDPAAARDLGKNAESAIRALESFRDWLTQQAPKMSSETAVGREGYVFFLKNVALLPYSPERLLEIGRDEWARSVAFQTYEEHRNQGHPPLEIFKTEADEIAGAKRDELAVRQYLESKGILSVPDWVQHYVVRPMPSYLDPIQGFGEADDLTSPSRLKEDGIRYINPPSANLGYFALSAAKDPRGEIVHEGVPGHYLQLALSWAHPDAIRRHYYDSGPNEGIGFYAEEMMLEAGLFDDSPRTREIIYNFMRLRALRVEVDVKLALGLFSIEQAARYLQRTVPMDAATARAEAAFFASSPGQAISYQIGKTQIIHFLAAAHSLQGDSFSLRAFHDSLWLNGNVPISLQRWQYLGEKSEIDAVDQMR